MSSDPYDDRPVTAQSIPPQPILVGIAAAAARVGVTASTLRTWGQRYGLSATARSTGGHRRFDETDLRRIELCVDLVGRGVPAAVAAQVARHTPSSSLAPPGGPTHRCSGRGASRARPRATRMSR